MALEVRDAIGALTETWRRLGHDIGFGIGIAHGFAKPACLSLRIGSVIAAAEWRYDVKCCAVFVGQFLVSLAVGASAQHNPHGSDDRDLGVAINRNGRGTLPGTSPRPADATR